MHRQILNWQTGAVIWEGDADTVRDAIHAAIVAKANLSGANLSGANLSGANLSWAHLSWANLSGANLSWANLSGANLSGANLSGANLSWANLSWAHLSWANLSGATLSWANLSGATLSWANLSGANLSGATLSGATLSGANLSGANLSGATLSGATLSGANLSLADLSRATLSGANLSGANGVQPERCTPLLMLLDQPGPIRAYKLVTDDYKSPIHTGCKPLVYTVGKTLSVKKADTDVNEQCGAGINVATLDWCLSSYSPGWRVVVVEFTAADIAAIPTATDGKFRVHRCTVVAEKDITALVKPPEPVVEKSA